MQVGLQLLPACCVFGGGGKEQEVHVGKNGQKSWFRLVWVFLVWQWWGVKRQRFASYTVFPIFRLVNELLVTKLAFQCLRGSSHAQELSPCILLTVLFI